MRQCKKAGHQTKKETTLTIVSCAVGESRMYFCN